MSDIIHVLPDSIANQIAAGEVIQRPASVVKELVENSIDAGATTIQLIIKDAGRTLIQVIDNGKGMSATDARMAFERHATSKIRKADDLFQLHTMGFRGEALPSIASVAQVELKTRQHEDEIGTLIRIAGSKLESQEPVACSAGSSFSVRNIFFNVPARRKFLKGNDTEKRNIITELERIALANPEINFTLNDNGVETIHWTSGGTLQRILQVVGKSFNQKLLAVNVETSLVKIHGFVGTPDSARKVRAQQFFFVNGRYMRHPYFAKAVSTAFEQLITPGEHPHFFLFLEVNPESIDVNIHPTKTEIKFENEQPIWQILNAVVKETLGKSNENPPLDFDMKDAVEIPIYVPNQPTIQPQVELTPNYNPFHTPSQTNNRFAYPNNRPIPKWEKLYEDFKKSTQEQVEESIATDDNKPLPLNFGSDTQVSYTEEEKYTTAEDSVHSSSNNIYLQYKQNYILTSVKSGLMLIDQHRAHVNILFYRFKQNLENHSGASQRILFPEVVELSSSESEVINHIADDLTAIGLELNALGRQSYAITGIPSEIEVPSPTDLLRSILDKVIDYQCNVKDEIHKIIALSIAESGAIKQNQKLSNEEMHHLVNQLFSTPLPNHTPHGKTIIHIIKNEDITKLFR